MGLLYVVAVVAMLVVGHHVTLPDAGPGTASPNSFTVAFLEATGRREPTDFLIDYASARALRARTDPYATSAVLIDRFGGPSWPVSTANPHPPTLLPIVLPFSLLNYHRALAAWVVAMIFAMILTIRFVGIRWAYAIAGGFGLCLLWPAAYGIGNPVPLVGLGVTVAWRYRNSPWIAAAGIAISAGSKTAGLLLAVPFVLSFRWRAISWAAAYIGVLAVTPVLLFHGVWQRYLDNGITAIRLNGERTDNASLLNAATKLAVPKVFVLAALAGAAVIVSIKARDTFWPATWLMVAALPVAWMYSLLTFLPLGIAAVRTGRTRPTVLVLLGLTFTIASPPLGFTATWMFPLVVALLLPVSGMTDESDFDIDWQRWLRRLPDSVRPRQMPTIAAMTDAS